MLYINNFNVRVSVPRDTLKILTRPACVGIGGRLRHDHGVSDVLPTQPHVRQTVVEEDLHRLELGHDLTVEWGLHVESGERDFKLDY